MVKKPYEEIMQRILNFRNLAKNAMNMEGKIIKPDTIFRSGALAYASGGDVKKLKKLGIRDIYDFRNDNERNIMPPLSDDFFSTHSYDILEEAAQADAKAYLDKTRQELDQGIIDLYANDFVNTEKYSGAIQNIANQDNPQFLFHCSAGKDRTGIFGAIIMMILDYDIKTIKNEYLILSKRSMRIMARQMLKKTGVKAKDVDVKKFAGVLGVFPQFIEAYLDSILSNYDLIDDYLKDKAGVTPEIKEHFKKTYLVTP